MLQTINPFPWILPQLPCADTVSNICDTLKHIHVRPSTHLNLFHRKYKPQAIVYIYPVYQVYRTRFRLLCAPEVFALQFLRMDTVPFVRWYTFVDVQGHQFLIIESCFHQQPRCHHPESLVFP